MISKSILQVGIGLLFVSAAAQAELFVYPQNGQSVEQTDKDKYECYNWAKQNSGFDPMAVPKASTPAPQTEQKRGGLVKGAAVGGVAGRVISGSSQTGKRSAAVGAAVGGLRQGSANRQAEQEKAQWEQNEVNNYNAQRNDYNRAYAACLDGRGYSVK